MELENEKRKPEIEITNARIEGERLIGVIFKHPSLDVNLQFGSKVHSSRILNHDGNRVETLNTVYLVKNWVEKYKENEMEDSHGPVAQKPTIGRTVWYQKYGTPGGEHKAEPSPAVVTKVEEDGWTCHLFVMNPNGCYFNKTPFSQELKGGHWSWPTRN